MIFGILRLGDVRLGTVDKPETAIASRSPLPNRAPNFDGRISPCVPIRKRSGVRAHAASGTCILFQETVRKVISS